ncbi:MAG: (d)CMP kinase [Candidatus Theseobacter exili]|nr:(d)CMP kinase [Candidatus Theseobacter exili]
MIIAIDGPSASGKSTVARIVARRMGFIHLDTGAMYRAITLKAMRNNVAFSDPVEMKEMAKDSIFKFIQEECNTLVFFDGENVTEEIRTRAVDANVSEVAMNDAIRNIVLIKSREIAANLNAVSEGRDIGTVVFPYAEKKFFLVANDETRAKRRFDEIIAKNHSADLEEIQKAMKLRDHKDSTRKNSPLKKADDALLVDTTDMTIEEVVSEICRISKN